MPRHPTRSIRITDRRGTWIEHKWPNLPDEKWAALCKELFTVIENFREDHINGQKIRGEREANELQGTEGVGQ